MIRADFHCHTHYSHDCFAGIGAVLEQAQRQELTHLAITDHDTLEGAFRARDRSRNVQILVGCEVSLAGGAHLIGLFLERPLQSRLLAEVIAEIRDQGGFVLVPHPFHLQSGLRKWPETDAVEAINGHEPPDHNRRAWQLAREHGYPMLAGSDAHYAVDIGRAVVEFPDATTLTPELLRTGTRRLLAPTQDLSTIHGADSQIRATTALRLRKIAPKPARVLAKWLLWSRCRRQIRAQLREPVRVEFSE